MEHGVRDDDEEHERDEQEQQPLRLAGKVVPRRGHDKARAAPPRGCFSGVGDHAHGGLLCVVARGPHRRDRAERAAGVGARLRLGLLGSGELRGGRALDGGDPWLDLELSTPATMVDGA